MGFDGFCSNENQGYTGGIIVPWMEEDMSVTWFIKVSIYSSYGATQAWINLVFHSYLCYPLC